ncbi:MAG: iron chelate uptake ABC transporter family permease subunit [Mesorhizobium sp.]
MASRRLLLLVAITICVMVAFMVIDLRGDLSFALQLRSVRLLALVEVAAAIGISTVIFQTVTGNYILTPSIMGLDAIYLFAQTAMVFAFGGLGFAAIDPRLKFSAEVVLMMLLALMLYLPMLRLRLDINLMLLTGVVLGIFFRSMSSLLARMIDPNDFAILQGASFASFGKVREDLLLVSALVAVTGGLIAWRARHVLDVMALGADPATSLGVDWRRSSAGILALVSALVAVSTALVGPITFLGLLAAAMAERIVGTRRHAVLLPAAVLVGVIVLVGGQTILQHGLGGASSLGVVIEFFGGLFFLAILSRGARS